MRPAAPTASKSSWAMMAISSGCNRVASSLVRLPNLTFPCISSPPLTQKRDGIYRLPYYALLGLHLAVSGSFDTYQISHFRDKGGVRRFSFAFTDIGKQFM